MAEYVHLNIMTVGGTQSACKLAPTDAWKGTNNEADVTCPRCRLTFDLSDWQDAIKNPPPRDAAVRAAFNRGSSVEIDTVMWRSGRWVSVFGGAEYYPGTTGPLFRWREPLEDLGELPKDLVNHPSHYTVGKFEVIDVIEDWRLGFHLGNAVKYIARSEHKGKKLEDLKKARWYLDREIQRLAEE